MAACVTQDRHSGGYDCQFVDIPRDADVICKICQIPSREPQISVCCGHTFCKSCLDTANSVVGSTIACPMCRCKDFQYVHNKQVERKVKSLHVLCTYQHIGCKWKGELSALDNHLDQLCEFQVNDCPNRCGEKVQRRHLQSHKKEICKCRDHTCELCQFIGGYNFVTTQHLEECPMLPLTCSYGCTSDSIFRKDLEAHDQACPLAPVKCKYDHIGCSVPMARMDQSKHYKNNTQYHLDLFERNQKLLHGELIKYKSTNSELKELLSQRYSAISQQNAKLTELEKQNHQLKDRLSQQDSVVSQHMQENRQLKNFISQQDSQYKILINKLGEEKEQLKQTQQRLEIVIQKQSNALNNTYTQQIRRLFHQNRDGIQSAVFYGTIMVAFVSVSFIFR